MGWFMGLPWVQHQDTIEDSPEVLWDQLQVVPPMGYARWCAITVVLVVSGIASAPTDAGL